LKLVSCKRNMWPRLLGYFLMVRYFLTLKRFVKFLDLTEYWAKKRFVKLLYLTQ
jgi:hypothetical protein